MSNEDRISRLKDKVEKLNAVSPTFCTAKWLTSTTTLYNGFTHSCHHPVPHKIKLEDLEKSSTALHNTPTKIAARQDMLDGVQTKECDYCWNIENLGEEHFSDRHYKSANVGMGLWENFDNAVDSGLGQNINPVYLEVAFENTCNFKCTYCSPDVSSRWMEEIVKHGGYKLANGDNHHDLDWLRGQGKLAYHHTEVNPYIDKFWEWWPELYQALHTFRITGGEPLLSKNTWRVFDYIKENPRKELKLEVNTNMGIPHKLVEKLVESINDIREKCKGVIIFTSAESVREQAEYSRFGMDWDLYVQNISYLLDNTPSDVTLGMMTTVDLLSSESFDDFIRFVCALRKKYDVNRARSRITLSVNYLRWPSHQQITLLDDVQRKVFADKMIAVVKEMTQGGYDVNGNLYIEEVDQINRLVDWINSTPQDTAQLANTYSVFSEMDTRRGTDFIKTFPSLEAIWNQGKAISEQAWKPLADPVWRSKT
jgi:organic radical activating enzyme